MIHSSGHPVQRTNGAIAQLVEHLHGMQGVSGSNPLGSILSDSLRRKGSFLFLECRPHREIRLAVAKAVAKQPVRLYRSFAAAKSAPMTSATQLSSTAAQI